MGAFLPTPKTDKELDNGEKAGLKYALGAMQGWRVEMEDAHTVEIKDKLGKDTCLFAVFDGHAGSAVAKKASTDLLNHVVKDKEQTDFNSMSEKDLKDRLRDGFLKLDKKLKESNENSGSTALVCTITPQMIVFSNCGDSRGFLCRDGKVHFHTEDHKPYNDGERSRIEKAGGTVMMQRVNGQLAVSRALGDFYYKGVESLGQTEQMVSPEPETTIIERDDKDQFVVLACDGVFDVMTNEEVAEFISRKLTEEKNLEVICSQLIDICLNKNSRDNMTVILVTFPGAPSVDEGAVEKAKDCKRKIEEEIVKYLKEIQEGANDPMDMEFMSTWSEVDRKISDSTELPITEFYLLKDFFGEQLDKLRKEKFGEDVEKSFSREDSDPNGPQAQFFNALQENIEDPVDPMEVHSGSGSHSSSDDSASGNPPRSPDESKPMEDS